LGDDGLKDADHSLADAFDALAHELEQWAALKKAGPRVDADAISRLEEAKGLADRGAEIARRLEWPPNGQ
jgi:uncharacterized membrane-anchored protein